MVSLDKVLVDMFNSSLRTSMREKLPHAEWSFSSYDDLDRVPSKEALFLSICSHKFRIFVVIHFTLDDCKDFLSASMNVNQDSLDSKAAYDFLLELSNSLCGMFKRDLGSAIPALGMSTPNILERGSFDFIKVFKAADVHFQKVEFNHLPLFYAGYYYCPNVDGDIEVDLDFMPVEDTSEAGELEFF